MNWVALIVLLTVGFCLGVLGNLLQREWMLGLGATCILASTVLAF